MRLEAMRRTEVGSAADAIFESIELAGNVVPTSMLTMARVPLLLDGYASLSAIVFAHGALPAELKRLVAHVASSAAGCSYCSIHNALRANRLGTSADRMSPGRRLPRRVRPRRGTPGFGACCRRMPAGGGPPV